MMIIAHWHQVEILLGGMKKKNHQLYKSGGVFQIVIHIV